MGEAGAGNSLIHGILAYHPLGSRGNSGAETFLDAETFRDLWFATRQNK